MSSIRVEFIPFRAAYAARIVGWLRRDEELALVSPETPPPLTAAKVRGWSGAGRRPFLIRDSRRRRMIGYVELNDMPQQARTLWIGHFFIAPPWRGHGLGSATVKALVREAFARFDATEVILVVRADNSAAIRCYQAAGMAVIGEEWRRPAGSGPAQRMLRMGIRNGTG